ncbi:WecB/TagA/CpsF family glycosyltransferase [Clostridium omnivorum]|uniref:Acetyl-mannosamine transferase n=1 Tax=Clostridium omnivorum TaxID=1604902 RepID=A0ABQ5N3D3_9CLOT|nr:WecB/TagA/CpsF family glycosyltransferase [Clostridium sp. E14]GLC29713.1 acetyl-mannosamine transferase [Clostridium sp. E14]
MSKMNFLNTAVDNITMDQAISAIDNLILIRENSYIVTPNVDHIVRIESDTEFREIYDNASLVLTDGQPLIWISKLLKTPIVEKVSGSDLFPKVCELAALKGYTMYFLGAAEGVADIAAAKLKKIYPGLKVVETYSPSFGFEKDALEAERIIKKVIDAQPDILVLALGTPKQEKFYYKYRTQFNVPLVLAVGASIDFVAGNIKRAPKWVSSYGFEWLYRLCKEPRRLFRRYIIDDMKIFRIVWKYRKRKYLNEDIN